MFLTVWHKMPRAEPYLTTSSPLLWSGATHILENLEHGKVIHEPLSSPRGGEVYVVQVNNTKRGRINPLADGVTWNQGSKTGVPHKSEIKQYYVRRHVYRTGTRR